MDGLKQVLGARKFLPLEAVEPAPGQVAGDGALGLAHALALAAQSLASPPRHSTSTTSTGAAAGTPSLATASWAATAFVALDYSSNGSLGPEDFDLKATLTLTLSLTLALTLTLAPTTPSV